MQDNEMLMRLVSTVLLAIAAFTHPIRWTCPTGMILPTGVRTQDLWGEPAGSFVCKRPPIGGDEDVLTGKSTAREQPGELRGRVYCTNGQLPIVVDYRTVGCQQRH